MKKRLLFLALSLVLCLGLTTPTLAMTEQPLTRAEFAVLLARYGAPENFDKGHGEVLLDCDGLSKEEKDAVTAVVNAGWLTSPVWGNFNPDKEILYWNVVSALAKATDPGFNSSSAPKRPNMAITGSDSPWAPEPGTQMVTEAEYEAAYAKWEQQYNEWIKQMSSKFTTLPDTNNAIASALCEPLEILYNKGVLDPNTVTADMWLQPITETTAEELVKAAFGYTEPNEPSSSAETVESTPTTLTFTDVPDDAYYAASVQWAVAHEITSGTGDGTTFSPNETCSKAQILTFLWHANGSPNPTAANPFSDIKTDDYYYKAALWAAENSLISGSTFNANTDCTRAMTVEYLWKAAGSPTPTGKASFTDVLPGAEFAQAVTWAVEQEITNGTGDGTTFSPDATCTRGQIVTLLHHAMKS